MSAIVLITEQNQLQMKMYRVRIAEIRLPSICHMEHLLSGFGVNTAKLGPRIWINRWFIRWRTFCFATLMSLKEMKAVNYPS